MLALSLVSAVVALECDGPDASKVNDKLEDIMADGGELAESVAEASSVLLSGADNAAAAELKRLRVRAELAETAYLSEKEHAAGMAQRLAEAAASGGVERELYEAEKELAVISAAAMQ